MTLINISIIIGCTLIGYLFGSFSCGKLVAKLAGLKELPLNKSGRISVASLWQSKHQILAIITVICVLLKFILVLIADFYIIKLDYNTYVICAEAAICDFDGNCHSTFISACTINTNVVSPEDDKFRLVKDCTYAAATLLCILAFIFGTFCPLRRKRQTK